jgi:hypothetical protein
MKIVKELSIMVDQADIVKNKIALNTVLLEKLRRQLISDKMKFAQSQMDLNNVKAIFRV